MSITNLFSKRQQQARGEMPDVFQYDDIPRALRVQLVHILVEVMGSNYQFVERPLVKSAYEFVFKTLCKEYGVFTLEGCRQQDSAFAQLMQFIQVERHVERVLDAIEMACLVIDRLTRDGDYLGNYQTAESIATSALEEINDRFKQHGVGYRYEDGKFIRIDSELVHAEVVKPALALLNDQRFAGAQAEFLKAHEHYRHGRYKESLTESLKALESTMKSIAKVRRWTVDPKATASGLVALMFEKGLVPAFWQTHFTGIRATLEAGVPTVRNKMGGHGQGADIVSVPEHVVAYALHQTAAAILFLVQAEKALP